MSKKQIDEYDAFVASRNKRVSIDVAPIAGQLELIFQLKKLDLVTVREAREALKRLDPYFEALLHGD